MDDDAVVDRLVADCMEGVTSRPMPVWHPVSFIPKYQCRYLVTKQPKRGSDGVPFVMICMYTDRFGWAETRVSHWMDLPQPQELKHE